MRVSQIVSGVVGALLLVVSVLGLTTARSDGDMRSDTAGSIPVRLYSAGPESPTVLVAHGFAGSAQLMEPLALGLHEAGFTVVSFDFPGHGANGEVLPFSGDVRSASWDTLTAPLAEVLDWAAQQPEVDRSRIALLGHSMGAGAAVSFAAEDASADGRVLATAALSLPSADDIPDGEPAVPRDLLLLYGALEPSAFADAALTGLRAAYPEGFPGVTYGDIGEGTARRAEAIPSVEHISILLSPATLDATVAWLSEALDVEPQPYGLPLLPLYAALALIGGALLLVPVSTLALGSREVRSWEPEPDPVRGGRVLAIVLVSSLLGVVAGWVAGPIADQVPVAVGGYLAVWFAVSGVVALLWWLLRIRAPRETPTITVRSTLGAVLVTALAALVVIVPGSMSWSAFSFTGARLWVAVLLLLVFGLWFAADELILRRTSTGRRVTLMITSRVLAVAALLGAIPVLGAPTFLVIVAPVLLLLLVLLGVYAAIVARRQDPYLAAVLVQAVPAAALVATTFPLVG
jgi:dienelactone hydrolase